MTALYSSLLKPAADATEYLSSTTLHPTYFPYPLALILHAARISHVYSTKVRAAGHNLPPFQHLAGFLVMAWGGALWTNALLCQPPPQLYSTAPWWIYCTTHVVLTSIFSVFPWPSGKLVDTAFPIIDAICRSGAIVGAISAVRAHSNPLVANSLLAQVIIGGVASVGGGAAAGFFGVWDKEWSIKTPSFLKGGVLATMDLWAGSVSAVIFGIATLSNPAYEDIATQLVGKPKAMMTPLGGRSLVVIYLTIMYVVRVAYTHYLPTRTAKPVAARPVVVNGGTAKQIKPLPKEKKSQ